MDKILSLADFLKLDFRSGTILKADVFPEAKRPTYKLWIDFGRQLGTLKSSAQICENYTVESLPGRQVIAVVNFPPKQIAHFMSDVLVTGFSDEKGNIVLSTIDKKVPNGTRML